MVGEFSCDWLAPPPGLSRRMRKHKRMPAMKPSPGAREALLCLQAVHMGVTCPCASTKQQGVRRLFQRNGWVWRNTIDKLTPPTVSANPLIIMGRVHKPWSPWVLLLLGYTLSAIPEKGRSGICFYTSYCGHNCTLNGGCQLGRLTPPISLAWFTAGCSTRMTTWSSLNHLFWQGGFCRVDWALLPLSTWLQLGVSVIGWELLPVPCNSGSCPTQTIWTPLLTTCYTRGIWCLWRDSTGPVTGACDPMYCNCWTHDETDAHHVSLSLRFPLVPLPQTSPLAPWSLQCKALHTMHWCNPNRLSGIWGGHPYLPALCPNEFLARRSRVRLAPPLSCLRDLWPHMILRLGTFALTMR